MVAVAQLVEPWIVIPVVVGSSPISHPNFLSLTDVGLFCFYATEISMLLFKIAKLLIEPLLFSPTQADHEH
jgi:hypothetical protein